MPTSWMFCARFCAVTTISSLSSERLSGVSVACAKAPAETVDSSAAAMTAWRVVMVSPWFAWCSRFAAVLPQAWPNSVARSAIRWSLVRSASACSVKVGLTAPAVGNSPVPAT